MFTDMVGYQDVLRHDESLGRYLLEKERSVIRQASSGHGGRYFGEEMAGAEGTGLKDWLTGGAVKIRETKFQSSESVVLFESALEATQCATEIQLMLREYNREAPSNKDIYVKIGVDVGEVLDREGGVLGEAVAVASRIAQVADPGGICVSEKAYRSLRDKFESPMIRIGRQELKNVELPIEVYRVVLPWEKQAPGEPISLDPHRLAILPLANISSDPNDEYFADGMTEELISTTSSITGLILIARTSVMRYKGQTRGIEEIGRELRVGTVLEGSVRKAGNRLRITVQLIDVQSQGHLWAQSYDRDLDDVFAVQSDIARQVADALKVRLLPNETRQLEKRPTKSVDAHILYLRARYHWSKRSEEGIKTAISYLEEVIEKDPKYSLALVGLADCHHISALFGYTSPRDAYPKVRELALRALEVGGDSAEAHASMGEFLMHYSYDWAGAARESERALQINPNCAIAHSWRSTCYAVLGQFDNAVAEARRGEQLDPFAVVAMNEIAKNYYYARRFDDAIKQFVHSLEIEPHSAYLHKGLAETYAQESMYNEAIREIDRALLISGRGALYLDSAASVYACSNEDRKSREVLAEADRLAENHFVPSYGRAAAYATLGDKEKALRFLQTAYDEHSWLIWLNVDPIFDSLKKEQAFHSLLRKMNLE